MRRRVVALSLASVLFLGLPGLLLAGTVTRGTKAGGGTDFQDGQTIEASEVNTDFNTLYNLVNGNIDGDNVSGIPWSDITGTKNPEDIDDTSNSATERDATLAPGTADPFRDNGTLATDLEDEVQQLRHQMLRSTIGLSPKFYDGSSAGEASWIESGALGPNMIRSGMFEVYTGDPNTPDPPDGWSKVGSPATIQLTVSGDFEGDGQEINVVSAGNAADGIEQTVGGIKQNGLYLIVARVKANTGKCHLRTNAGATSGSFQDLGEDHAVTTTTGSYETLAGIVQGDATTTPSDIDVELLSDTDATADSCNWRSVRMHEIGEDLLTTFPVFPVFATSTDTSQNYVDTSWTKAQNTAGNADLQAAVTIPSSNYVIIVYGWLSMALTTGSAVDVVAARLDENGSSIDSSIAYNASAEGASSSLTIPVFYMNTSPSSDTTYTYKIEAKTENSGNHGANPTTVTGAQSTTGIAVLAIPVGG